MRATSDERLIERNETPDRIADDPDHQAGYVWLAQTESNECQKSTMSDQTGKAAFDDECHLAQEAEKKLSEDLYQKRYESLIKPRWGATVLRTGPMSGLACLCLALASICTSLAVLVISNGQAESAWRYQPSTCLAVLTVIANQSMRYAALQGVVIAWWMKAAREKGNSLSSLHYDWDMGTTLKGALHAGRRINLLALVCISATLVTVDGPLLQQASRVVTAGIPENDSTKVSLKFNVVPELPSKYSGYANATALPGWLDMANTVANNRFLSGPYRDSISNDTLYSYVKGCPSTCRAKIRAPAFAIRDCHRLVGPVNFSGPADVIPNAWPVTVPSPAFIEAAKAMLPSYSMDGAKVVFYANVFWTVEDQENLNITAIHPIIDDWDNCSGQFNYTSCTLQSATAEHDILISNLSNAAGWTSSSITLPDSVAYPSIVDSTNETISLSGLNRSSESIEASLPGFSFTAPRSMVIRRYDNVDDGDGYVYRSEQASFLYQHRQPQSRDRCHGFDDPFETMLDSLNRVMIRSGFEIGQRLHDGTAAEIDLGAGHHAQQTVSGHLSGSWTVYQSDFAWFYAASAVELTCLLIILLTYWGWWKLGRSVSFSPLEIAKAFDAPLLADMDSRLEAKELAKAVEHVKVRYAVAEEKGSAIDLGTDRHGTPGKNVFVELEKPAWEA